MIDFELMSIQEGLPSLDACTVLTVLSLLFAFTRRLAFIESFQRASTKVPKCLKLIWRIPRAHDTPKSSCQTLPVSKYFSCHAEMWAPNNHAEMQDNHRCVWTLDPGSHQLNIKKSTDLTGLDSSGRKQLEVHAPDDRIYQLQVMVLDKSLGGG